MDATRQDQPSGAMKTYGLTDAQLAERRLGIGGSDAAKIVAGEWYALWLDKLGRAAPKKIMSDWNRALRDVTEGLQLDWYESRGGGAVTRRGEVAVSGTHPFMRCTLDGWVEKLRCPINAKHVSSWTKQARDWTIAHYTSQITHEALVTGAPFGLISLLVGEKEPETIRIDVDPWFADELIAKETEFWGYVTRGEPPPDAPAMEVPTVATERLRRIDLNEERPNWREEFVQLATTFIGTLAASRKHHATREAIGKLVPDDVGEIAWGGFHLKRTKANALVMTADKPEKPPAC